MNPKNVGMGYLHLIDNLTGADIDLLQTPSYTFEAHKYDYTARFKLVFANGDNDGHDNFAFIDGNGNIVINGDGIVQVIDLLGHVLASYINENRISTEGMSSGVYLLRLIDNKQIKTQKIVIQ